MKRKNITNRIISLFISVLIILSSFTLVASASSSFTSDNIIETSVIDDLSKMKIDNKTFNVSDYSLDRDADYCRMLYFYEHGYDARGDQKDYGLYVYVYNPSGKEVLDNPDLNFIQIATKKKLSADTFFSKYKLKLLDSDCPEGYENVFLKFKVLYADRLLENISPSLRIYEISGIELRFKGENVSTDYLVGGRYVYNGYSPYHNIDRTKSSSLKVDITDMLTVELDLRSTNWKSLTSDKGEGYAYELFSVYFAIPNDIIRKYGDKDNSITKGLVQVDGVYDEHRINGLIVGSQTNYGVVYPYLGKNTLNNDIPFNFYSSCKNYSAGGLITNHEYTNPYNVEFYSDLSGSAYVTDKGNRAGIEIYTLNSLFKYSEDSFEGVSQDQVLSQLEEIWSDYGYLYSDPYGPLARPLGDGLKYSIYAGVDMSEQIRVYSDVNRGFWDKYINATLYDEKEYDDITSIQAVDTVDLSVGSVYKTDEAIASEYYINENDVSSFKSYVSSSALGNETTYLMRFAVRDYYCADVELSGSNIIDDDAYYFEKTIFKNFDVIQLTFEDKYSQSVVIPVISTPISIVGSVDTTLEGQTKFEQWVDDLFNAKKDVDSFLDVLDDMKFVIVLFAILLVLFAVNWILKIFGTSLSGVLKAIVNIFAAPFKLLSRADDKYYKRKLDKAEERRKDSDNRRKDDDLSLRKRDSVRKDHEDIRAYREDRRKQADLELRKQESRRKDNEDRRRDATLDLKRRDDRRKNSELYIKEKQSERKDAYLSMDQEKHGWKRQDRKEKRNKNKK